jgi:hypothetical protein
MLTNSERTSPKTEGNFLFITPTKGTGTPGFYNAKNKKLAFNFKTENEKDGFIDYLNISADLHFVSNSEACTLYFKQEASRTYVDLTRRDNVSEVIKKVDQLITNSQPEELQKTEVKSLIIQAAQKQVHEIVKLLIDKNSDVITELDDQTKKCVFETAVKYLNLPIAKQLLTADESVAKGTEALHELLTNKSNPNYRLEFITELLKDNPNVMCFTNKGGYSLFHIAIQDGDLVESLLALNPPKEVLNPQSPGGPVPLIDFVAFYQYNNKYKLLSKLINYNPEAAYETDQNGSNIFHILGRHIKAQYFLDNHLELVKKMVFMKQTSVLNSEGRYQKSDNGADSCDNFLGKILSSHEMETLDKLLHHIPKIANTPTVLSDHRDSPLVAKIISKMTINPLNPLDDTLLKPYFTPGYVQKLLENIKSSLDKAKTYCEEQIDNENQISREEYAYFSFIRSKILAFSSNDQELIGMNIDSFYKYLQSHYNHSDFAINELVPLALPETGTEESTVSPLGTDGQHFTD